jgi:hypothetical protein
MGGDSSTSVSVQVDETGTGKKFVAGKVTKNGNPVCGEPKPHDSTSRTDYLLIETVQS